MDQSLADEDVLLALQIQTSPKNLVEYWHVFMSDEMPQDRAFLILHPEGDPTSISLA